MKLESVNLKQIRIRDEFWSKHMKLVKDTILPYQWAAINNKIPGIELSNSLENYRIAAGRSNRTFQGLVFQDTDVAKWLEAVGFVLAYSQDAELEKIADEVIDIIGEAQCADGYLNTYFTIVEPDRRWKNLCEGHELYTSGHLMEAACSYYLSTGKDKLLCIMKKNADLICDVFGPEDKKLHGYPGHQEVEIGLIKMYEVTGVRKYLEQAKYFIDIRGVGENYFIKEINTPGFRFFFPEFKDYQPIYSQSHLPVREQMTAEGHAVRAVYMYTAMAALAYEYSDQELMAACERLWNNMVNRRRYITGSIGSSGILERFTTDYDLPNDCNYSETCASIGLLFFAKRMANITRDAKYIDVLETTLYNTVLAGISLDGNRFFYVNPLEVWPNNCLDRTSKEHVKPVRQKWFGVACCPTNIARTFASLGQYIYSFDQESLYVHLFISNSMDVRIKNQEVRVTLETKFPWENHIVLCCNNIPEDGVKVAIRIPAYAKEYTLRIEGETIPYSTEKGYATVKMVRDTTIEIDFEAPARFMRSNPNVRADLGKVAIVRGPIVYCLEEVDNFKNLQTVFVDTTKKIKEREVDSPCNLLALDCSGYKIIEEEWKEDQLYDYNKVTCKPVQLRAIPYAYWGNRGQQEMCVWMKEWFCGERYSSEGI